MIEGECKRSIFQKNTSFRILRKILFSKEEKVRDMYGKKEMVTGYIEEMPLKASADDFFAHGSEKDLKDQYLSYWSQHLELDTEKQQKMSEIWDAGILEKFRNPEIGKTAVFFQDGRKLTEDRLISILLETFEL